MDKAACKTQLKARIKHTHSRKERGKALGAYQKCIKGKGRRKSHRRRRSSRSWF